MGKEQNASYTKVVTPMHAHHMMLLGDIFPNLDFQVTVRYGRIMRKREHRSVVVNRPPSSAFTSTSYHGFQTYTSRSTAKSSAVQTRALVLDGDAKENRTWISSPSILCSSVFVWVRRQVARPAEGVGEEWACAIWIIWII
jgi:hypothetical protein